LSYTEKTSAAEGWIGFETVLWRFMGALEYEYQESPVDM